MLELVETPGDPRHPWTTEETRAEVAVRGLHSVTLHSADPKASAAFLATEMGFEEVGTEGDRRRFRAPGALVAGVVDLLGRPDAPPGRMGVGAVHHVAWRVVDDEAQAEWPGLFRAGGIRVTPIQDRTYFQSVYFREPGAVLFELATDTPGFMVDEPEESLGGKFVLPEHLEPARARIESTVPRFTSPAGVRYP